MPASRAGTKRCSPADMSIQFKQLSACQGEEGEGEQLTAWKAFLQAQDLQQKFLVGFRQNHLTLDFLPSAYQQRLMFSPLK